MDPAFRLICVSHSNDELDFIWKIDFIYCLKNEPLIFVLFLKGKQNKI